MSQTSPSTTAPEPEVPAPGSDHVIAVVDRKVATLFGAVTLGLAALAFFGSQSGDTTFRLASRRDLFELPEITVPAVGTAWAMVVVMALCTGEAVRRYRTKRPTPLWLSIVFALLGMVGFLSWAAAGGTIPMVGLLGGSLAVAVPLVFGALGGVLGERSGVVNIAIDGQLLAGAFAAALVGSITGSIWGGMAGALMAGALVAALLGVFAVTYAVDQIIVGVVLNVLVIGITSFMFSQVLAPNASTLNSPPRLKSIAIPVLGDIPLVGPVLFRQSLLVYLLYIAVGVITWALYRTRWGLRVRSVGEHPKAADTVGIKVNRTRFRTVLLAGAVAGLGGAFYTMVSAQAFNREMTGGAGYIALAAVIFGKWDPIRATLAALLFGFASNLQGVLSVLGSPVPSQFMLMMPYVVTILAVAGLVGRSRPPAGVGQPYRKG